MKLPIDIMDDARFLFEPVQIDKPSDLKEFIERYRRLDDKYNNFMNEYSVSFYDGNLRHICRGDFDMLIEDNRDNPYSGIGLSELESIILRSFLMRSSGLYRLDAYRPIIPPIVITLCEILDSALNKLPRFTGELLTRACIEEDRVDFRIGEKFVPNYALTTSADKTWREGVDVVYIITPLKENTRACAVYNINDTPEKQATFMSGTPFMVKDIRRHGTNKIEIYLEEVNL